MPASADVRDTIERVKPAVVAVGTFQASRNPQFRALGTGFAVGTGRQIITNAHVVPVQLAAEQGERMAVAQVTGGRAGRMYIVEKQRVVEAHDIALLRIDASSPALPALKLRDEMLREGSQVLFSGFPAGEALGLFPVTHRGMVSAISPNGIPAGNARALDAAAVRRLAANAFDIYQLDGTAYPGVSGSPVYDPDSGEVVAIINMVLVRGGREYALSAPTGITYAVPAKHIVEMLRDAP